MTVASRLLYLVPGELDSDRVEMAFEAAIFAPFGVLAGWRQSNLQVTP